MLVGAIINQLEVWRRFWVLSLKLSTVVTKSSFYDVSTIPPSFTRKYLSYILKVTYLKYVCVEQHWCHVEQGRPFGMLSLNLKCTRHISKHCFEGSENRCFCVLALLRSSNWILNVPFSYEVIRNMYCWEAIAVSVF